MKKYVLIFGVMAAFVFAACDSSGGGGLPETETTSYVSADEKTVLTLTYPAAVQKSPARKAPAAGQSGNYTLTVNGIIESEGRFQSSGTKLDFISNTGKTFSAAVSGNSLDFSGSPIPLETSGGEFKLSMTEDAGDPDYGDDGVWKSIKITDLPNGTANVQVDVKDVKYVEEDEKPDALTGPGSDVDGSDGVVEIRLYLCDENNQVTDEKWTGTGRFHVHLLFWGGGLNENKWYETKERIPFYSALTTVSFSAFEERIEE